MRCSVGRNERLTHVGAPCTKFDDTATTSTALPALLLNECVELIVARTILARVCAFLAQGTCAQGTGWLWACRDVVGDMFGGNKDAAMGTRTVGQVWCGELLLAQSKLVQALDRDAAGAGGNVVRGDVISTTDWCIRVFGCERGIKTLGEANRADVMVTRQPNEVRGVVISTTPGANWSAMGHVAEREGNL